MIARFSEYGGTPGIDVLSIGQGAIAFGFGGDDSFFSSPGIGHQVLVGGEGSDTYHIGIGSTTTIVERGTTGSDTVIAPGISFANSVAALIDGVHLAAYGTVTGTTIIGLNWTQGATIETIQLSDTTDIEQVREVENPYILP